MKENEEGKGEGKMDSFLNIMIQNVEKNDTMKS